MPAIMLPLSENTIIVLDSLSNISNEWNWFQLEDNTVDVSGLGLAIGDCQMKQKLQQISILFIFNVHDESSQLPDIHAV
jgi:hypothetical protein